MIGAFREEVLYCELRSIYFYEVAAEWLTLSQEHEELI